MFWTIEKAISAAIKQARNINSELYIVREDDAFDYCSLYQLDTFYAGIPDRHILATVFPDGEIQY